MPWSELVVCPIINWIKSELLLYQLLDKYQRHGIAIGYPGTAQECLSSEICDVKSSQRKTSGRNYFYHHIWSLQFMGVSSANMTLKANHPASEKNVRFTKNLLFFSFKANAIIISSCRQALSGHSFICSEIELGQAQYASLNFSASETFPSP